MNKHDKHVNNRRHYIVQDIHTFTSSQYALASNQTCPQACQSFEGSVVPLLPTFPFQPWVQLHEHINTASTP